MSKTSRLHLHTGPFDRQVLMSAKTQDACVHAAQNGTRGDDRYYISRDTKSKHRRGCAVFAYNTTLLNRAIGSMRS